MNEILQIKKIIECHKRNNKKNLVTNVLIKTNDAIQVADVFDKQQDTDFERQKM